MAARDRVTCDDDRTCADAPWARGHRRGRSRAAGAAPRAAATTVTAQDPENPQYGSIQMKFTGPTPELRQWIINDGNGSQTTVVLGELQKGGNLANKLFDVGSPGSVNR